MKLNFKVNNVLNENINIDKIKLSSHNPRYTTLKSIKENLLEKIINNDGKTQEEVFHDLLENEGDFSDFVNLLDSILNIGFDTQIESLILIENKEKNGWVIGEGNRRTLCLKLMTDGVSKLPSIDLMQNTDDSDRLTSYDEEKSEKYLDKKRRNYKQIKSLLIEISQKYKEKTFVVDVKIARDNKELWKMIYTKHIAGERPGMRQWKRGKYFTDILSFFKDGIKSGDKLSNEIRTLLQREPTIIIDDFRNAQFVHAILSRANIYTASSNEVTDDIIYSVMKKIKVSALQPIFSLKRIKNSAENYSKISVDVFKDKYFEHWFDDNNLIKFSENKKCNEILKFIYKFYSEGIITTRPIKTNDQNYFNLEVKKLLKYESIDTAKKQSVKTLQKIDSFDFSIKQLEQIIYNAESSEFEESIIKRFKITKKIKEDNKIIHKLDYFFIENNKPFEVFLVLKNQYIHNEENKTFLNAMSATLRSILEQIIIWGGYFIDDIVRIVKPGNKEIESRKENYIKDMADGEIYKMFSIIRKNGFLEVHINNILESITNDGVDVSIHAKFIFNNRKEINSVLNEFIHASHRIYNKSIYSENLEKFNNWQSHIFFILNNIDKEKLKELSKKIKNILDIGKNN